MVFKFVKIYEKKYLHHSVSIVKIIVHKLFISSDLFARLPNCNLPWTIPRLEERLTMTT